MVKAVRRFLVPFGVAIGMTLPFAGGAHAAAVTATAADCAANNIPGIHIPNPSLCNFYDVILDAGPSYQFNLADGYGWLNNAWVVGNLGGAHDDVAFSGQVIPLDRSSLSSWKKDQVRVLRNNGDGTFSDAPNFFASGTVSSQYLCSQMTALLYAGDTSLSFACANEGIDTYPFSGEPSQLFIPSPGGYVNAAVQGMAGTTQGHADSSGVIDASGRPAVLIVVVGAPSDLSAPPVPPYLIVRNADGSFSANTARMPHDVTELWSSGQYLTRRYSAGALIDTRGTGLADLVMGAALRSPQYPGRDSNGNIVATYPSAVYLNPGNGDFSSAAPIPLPAGCFGDYSEVIDIQSADLDGNHVPYLLLHMAHVDPALNGGYLESCLQILKKQGDAYVDVTRQLVPGGLPPMSLADHRIKVLDVNGDGYLDIISQGWSDGYASTFTGAHPREENVILLNDGSNRFSVLGDGFLPALPYHTEAMIPIDLQGNGHVSFLIPYDSYVNGQEFRKFAVLKWKADQPRALSAAADCLFNWAEQAYASLLTPSGSATLATGPYVYRHYAGTNSYVGTAPAANRLYYLGPASNNVLLDLGDLSPWLDRAGCD
jgi:hypothetical protein